MKFDSDKVNGATAGLCLVSKDTGEAAINGNIEALVCILRAYSFTCGEKTKRKLIAAITGRHFDPSPEYKEFVRCGVDYSDTEIRGCHYVYLWFDSNGELFYIGKGIHERANNMYRRSAEFQERAKGGCCRYIAYNMDEIYALDLERILIWEAAFSGKQLLNVNGGNGVEAVQYCKYDRDALLWYWNHEGVIDRFSELTGIDVIYDARNANISEAVDSRRVWWERWGEQRTNDPKILEELRKAEEKKQKRREYDRNRRKNRSESA